MKYFIITGTSRGIGESIAEQLISPNHYLYCISRGKNADLVRKSKNIKYYEVDLNQFQQIESLMESIFNSIDFSKAVGIYLINNASIIAPVTFIDTAMISDITQNINVNLIAPILLTSLFIKNSNKYLIEKRILNISSASVKYHHPGMSLYSAAKAGLDVFSQCVGLEQNHSIAPVGVVSIWPGMIDTNLQREARNQDKSTFPSANLFQNVKDAGMLSTPEETAKQIIEFLFKTDFEHGTVVDIYDYSKVQQTYD
ncbi:SDR family NAD(P)-dependent oxidoreductase [Paenibacillus sp. MAH-36]|uniref:SDR family NAD(P)-dependent oxidoreductase n=1 Tax=Paenibacillus violae TaxID=3077234 RepID=A0ABU3RPY2_9BACL|nr:SDR family NAD(P)-dependent oxidoreductase [Paenibacillus sp. PFR10]MDU0206344.1 SDR family NAD(P)-dependent oxidoreductase [Paenibacillus sp. PFR10]